MTTPSAARIGAKYQLGLRKNGAPILLRHIKRINGPTPIENPCSASALLVNGAFLAGASTISLRAASLEGFLRAGDVITIASTAYTVAADTAAASSNAIASISIAPALAADAADGDAAPVTFYGETALRATVSSYPIQLINGTTIQSQDLRMIVAAFDLKDPPQTEDQVVFNGTTYAVQSASPRYVGPTVVGWDIQVR